MGPWLVGTGRAMPALAREHAVDGVRVAADDLGSLLAEAAAGEAALAAARHCRQVLGGIGFTAEHLLHRRVRRSVVLDGLLGSARELTRDAGALSRAESGARRLMQL